MIERKDNVRIDVSGLTRTFVLHNQNHAEIPVLNNVNFKVSEGECLVLNGCSGSGKSSLMRTLYGNYRVGSGKVRIRGEQGWVDMALASPRQVISLRRSSLGYVSQFLRVIPRVSTLDVTMQPLLELGVNKEDCLDRAKGMLRRLNVPERLWLLPPATFSGGEQQRVNVARGFMVNYPVFLLDEPTASLDSKNSQVVMELISEARQRGAAIVGIFHDNALRDQIADRQLMMNGEANAA